MKNAELNLESVFEEIIERGREEGVVTHEAFRDLVEDVVAMHADIGSMGDDTSSADVTEQLTGRFPDYQAALGTDSTRDEVDL
jgi:hypothetical protein